MSGGGVERHYAQDGLIAAIRERLRRAGKDPDRLTPADLATIDEFHVRGRQATIELAEKVKPAATDRVLDIGCGIGGAARQLAAAYGCRVVGIDLVPAYCQVAAELAAWVGLADRVEYRQADALDLPFADGSFDLAWTQHAAMNIPDKVRLYAEVRHVLRPGGRLALYDVVRGGGGEVLYPVPWAREPSISHLVAADELRRLLAGAGFEVESWRDASAAGIGSLAEVVRRMRANEAPPLALSVLLGADGLPMAENLRRNLAEGRLALVEAVARRG